MKILMCKPTFYNIDYEINPWMNVRIKSDAVNATVQWSKLYQVLLSLGLQIELIEPVNGLPDMVFTANAGLVMSGRVCLSQFKHKERQGEQIHFRHWFAKANYEIMDPIRETAEAFFEGEGDALFSNRKLFAGFGIRSDKDFYQNLLSTTPNNIEKIIYCELLDPYFYHLDTCFCPLNESYGLWWPSAFSPQTQQSMQEQLQMFAVPESEARKFACNAIVVGKNVVLPAGCPETTRFLTTNGFKVHACDMHEFIKAGGACKCLVLYI